MPPEKGTPNAPKTPTPVAGATPSLPAASAGPAPESSVRLTLSDAQFERLEARLDRLERVLSYGFIAAGVVFNQPGMTPTRANMKKIKDLSVALGELVEERGK